METFTNVMAVLGVASVLACVWAAFLKVKEWVEDLDMMQTQMRRWNAELETAIDYLEYRVSHLESAHGPGKTDES